MLWGVVVGPFHRFLKVRHRDRDRVLDGSSDDAYAWKGICLLINLIFDGSQLFLIKVDCYQDDLAVCPVLSLTQQIRCDKCWISSLIRNDKNLAWSGRHVDADTSRGVVADNHLCSCNELIARTKNLVDFAH